MDKNEFQAKAKKAMAGDQFAQLELAAAFYNGEGVEQSFENAKRWYSSSAGQGVGTAFHMLGIMAQEGQGQNKDNKIACEYYQKGAEAGNYRSALNLGVLYELGDGVKKDLEKAKHYYQIAASGGVARAAYNLAALRYSESKTPEEFGTALVAYCKAFDLGYEKAKEGILNCLDAMKIDKIIRAVIAE